MSLGEPGVEVARSEAAETDVIKPGPLVESMYSGLMRILGWEQTFATLRGYQQEMIEGSASPDDLRDSIEELHRTLSTEPKVPGTLFDFLEDRASYSIYPAKLLAKVGAVDFLLSAKDKLIESERQTWLGGSVVQEWLGKSVILRRPPATVTREDKSWGNRGPLYQGLANGEPIDDRYYRGGDKPGFHGKLQQVSLEQNGTLILDLGGQKAVEVVELFEAIEDPKTKVITGYVPRLSVEIETRMNRLKRTARQAAIERLGSELQG